MLSEFTFGLSECGKQSTQVGWAAQETNCFLRVIDIIGQAPAVWRRLRS
jgi:hypothetical protein